MGWKSKEMRENITWLASAPLSKHGYAKQTQLRSAKTDIAVITLIAEPGYLRSALTAKLTSGHW